MRSASAEPIHIATEEGRFLSATGNPNTTLRGQDHAGWGWAPSPILSLIFRWDVPQRTLGCYSLVCRPWAAVATQGPSAPPRWRASTFLACEETVRKWAPDWLRSIRELVVDQSCGRVTQLPPLFPNLRAVEYCGSGLLVSFVPLLSLGHLHTVKIDDHAEWPVLYRFEVVALLEGVPTLQVLHLNGCFMEMWGDGCIVVPAHLHELQVRLITSNPELKLDVRSAASLTVFDFVNIEVVGLPSLLSHVDVTYDVGYIPLSTDRRLGSLVRVESIKPNTGWATGLEPAMRPAASADTTWFGFSSYGSRLRALVEIMQRVTLRSLRLRSFSGPVPAAAGTLSGLQWAHNVVNLDLRAILYRDAASSLVHCVRGCRAVRFFGLPCQMSHIEDVLSVLEALPALEIASQLYSDFITLAVTHPSRRVVTHAPCTEEDAPNHRVALQMNLWTLELAAWRPASSLSSASRSSSSFPPVGRGAVVLVQLPTEDSHERLVSVLHRGVSLRSSADCTEPIHETRLSDPTLPLSPWPIETSSTTEEAHLEMSVSVLLDLMNSDWAM